MKLWISMLLIMSLIIAGGIVLEQAILKTTNQISRSLDAVKEAVRNDQWSEALKYVEAIEDKWRSVKEVWSPFIHNHDLDVVGLHMARLKMFLETREKGLALAEITNIEIELVLIHQQEVLTLNNVL